MHLLIKIPSNNNQEWFIRHSYLTPIPLKKKPRYEN